MLESTHERDQEKEIGVRRHRREVKVEEAEAIIEGEASDIIALHRGQNS